MVAASTPQARRLLAGGALRAVAGGDVADLVADHPGQVGLAFHVGHQAAGDVDIAAGQREGVDLRAVEHREMPFQVLAVRLLGQALAQLVHISLQPGIRIGAVFLQHLFVGLPALGDLAALVHHRDLALPGDGIGHGGAAGQQG
jgi:hypothetical protein